MPEVRVEDGPEWNKEQPRRRGDIGSGSGFSTASCKLVRLPQPRQREEVLWAPASFHKPNWRKLQVTGRQGLKHQAKHMTGRIPTVPCLDLGEGGLDMGRQTPKNDSDDMKVEGHKAKVLSARARLMNNCEVAIW